MLVNVGLPHCLMAKQWCFASASRMMTHHKTRMITQWEEKPEKVQAFLSVSAPLSELSIPPDTCGSTLFEETQIASLPREGVIGIRAVLIMNRVSGTSTMATTQGTPEEHEAAILAGLRSYGIEVEVRQTTREDPGVGVAAQAAAEQTDVVIAAGGDGTIHEVARGLIGRLRVSPACLEWRPKLNEKMDFLAMAFLNDFLQHSR